MKCIQNTGFKDPGGGLLELGEEEEREERSRRNSRFPVQTTVRAMAPYRAIMERIQVGANPSPRNVPQRHMSRCKSLGNINITCKEPCMGYSF